MRGMLKFLGCLECLAILGCGDAHTVAEHDHRRGHGGNAGTAVEDAAQIEWIGGADRYDFSSRFAAPDLSCQRYGVRQRELLARNSGHEPAAANISTRFEAPIYA